MEGTAATAACPDEGASLGGNDGAARSTGRTPVGDGTGRELRRSVARRAALLRSSTRPTEAAPCAPLPLTSAPTAALAAFSSSPAWACALASVRRAGGACGGGGSGTRTASPAAAAAMPAATAAASSPTLVPDPAASSRLVRRPALPTRLGCGALGAAAAGRRVGRKARLPAVPLKASAQSESSPTSRRKRRASSSSQPSSSSSSSSSSSRATPAGSRVMAM
mmetsp:Transcript_76793/g.206963  ORF Transcript_76793/g.206963 Transcript_76793/m.206963 type:complete len:222 (-) Transcript_76793:16-681(-)